MLQRRTQPLRQLLRQLPQCGRALLQQIFQQDQQKIVPAPEQEAPAGTVPDAGETPDRQKIQAEPAEAHPVAAQGNVYIIPEKGGQGNVPAAPEIPDGHCHIGIVEVLGVGEAADLTEAQGHVGIGGEIQIELQHVAETAQPGAQHRGLPAAQEAEGQKALAELSQMIRQQTFLGEARQKTAEAQQKAVHRMLPLRKLPGQRREAHDRALTDDLKVHGIQQRFKKRLCRYAFFVYIRKIGNQPENIEGNAQGKQQLRHRQTQGAQEKTGILKEDQHQQEQCNAALQPAPGLPAGLLLFRKLPVLSRQQYRFLLRHRFFDLSADVPAQHPQGQEQQKAAQTGEAVEDQGKQQKHAVFVPDARHQEVEEEKKRQKGRNKDQC